MKPLLVVIAGPTAIGKTSISIILAQHYSCPILSADSRQVYKEMHVGTAVPDKAELKKARHYFIQTHSIFDPISAGQFEKECISLLDKLFLKHPIVILCGGSGLYIDAVLFGTDELPPANNQLRNDLKKLFEEKGIIALQEQLIILDPIYYNQVDKNNPQRLMRALEVCIQSGKPYSSLRLAANKIRNFDFMLFGINEDRQTLYDRINKRVGDMISRGLLEEVKSLKNYRDLNAIQTVGYTELFNYLEGQCSFDDAVNKIKQHTRNFAKRQITWLKKYESIHWVKSNESEKIIQLVDEHLG